MTRDEAGPLRDQLVSLLAEDTHNTERLTMRLDALARETGLGVHAALLTILTQLPFDEQEAREHWEGILAQRHALSLALGRDVGLRVATLDYFMNDYVGHLRHHLKQILGIEWDSRRDGHHG